MGFIILFFGLIYVGVALQASRKLLGHWTYKEWKQRSYGGKSLEDYDYGIGGEWIGALALSLIALPIVMLMNHSYDNNGQWHIDPKFVRQEREITAYKSKIAELERDAGI